jgi:hypothetical protein
MTPAALHDIRTVGLALLSSFAMAHLIALVYVWTHRGISYSQSYIQTLVLSSVAASVMMLTIGNNIVWGVGIVGAMALVRFRTNLRDPRDMVFIFAALIAGIAAGTRSYVVGVTGTAVFSLAALYLAVVPFGARKSYDGLLRFTMPWEGSAALAAPEAIKRHCRKFVLATVREVTQGEASEHVYHVRFRCEESRHELARDLAGVPGLSGVSILVEDTRTEI